MLLDRLCKPVNKAESDPRLYLITSSPRRRPLGFSRPPRLAQVKFHQARQGEEGMHPGREHSQNLHPKEKVSIMICYGERAISEEWKIQNTYHIGLTRQLLQNPLDRLHHILVKEHPIRLYINISRYVVKERRVAQFIRPRDFCRVYCPLITLFICLVGTDDYWKKCLFLGRDNLF